MAGEWRELPFSEAVVLNPPVQLERGSRYPFVDMGAVSPGSRCAYATEEREFSGGGSRFQHGDTLMARITPCLENGKIARFCAPQGSVVGHGSTEFIVVRGRPRITDTDYAYYLTQWEEVRNYAIGQMTGTSGRQRVPTDSFDHLDVPVPPLPEQRAIAHILGTLDDKIELNRRMSETLEAMARALFKAWFVDFEPVRAKAAVRSEHPDWTNEQVSRTACPNLKPEIAALFPDSFVDSELGEIPKGWEVGRLGDLAEVTSGKRPDDKFARAIPGANVPLWGGNGPMAFVRQPLFTEPILLTGRVGTLGSVFRITTECWPSDNTLVVLPRKQLYREYLYLSMKQIDFDSLNRGSTQPLLTQTDLKSQPLVIPVNDVLGEFHRTADALYAKMDATSRESRTLAALRDTLLPKLISGELRVKDAEKFLEERGL